jgi:hypothetical protein
LFHRLATLAEDDPDFGKVMPMDPWDLRAASEFARGPETVLQHQARFINLLMTAPCIATAGQDHQSGLRRHPGSELLCCG